MKARVNKFRLAPVAMALLAMGAAQVQALEAGTLIEGSGYAVYMVAGDVSTYRATALTVAAQIVGVETLSLSSAAALSAAPGKDVAYPYVLTNTGNMTGRFRVSIVSETGDFALSGIAIHADINGNGVVDAGDPVVSVAGAEIMIEAGRSVNLLVSGKVPLTVLSGQSAKFRLQAQGLNQGRMVTANGEVRATATASVPLRLSLGAQAVLPAEVVAVSLVGTNNGNAPASTMAVIDGALLRVDGAVRAGTVFSLPIPAGTRYVSGSLSSPIPGGTLLYRAVGAAPGQYSSAEMADVAEVAILFESGMAANAVQAINLSLAVLPSASGQIHVAGRYVSGEGVSASNVGILSVAAATGPDLVTMQYHNGDVAVGESFDQTLVVQNVGRNATSGRVFVRENLPAGVLFVGATSAEWTCAAISEGVECYTDAPIQPGARVSPVVLKLQIPEGMMGGALDKAFALLARVSGGGEDASRQANNEAVDTVRALLGGSVAGHVWHDANHDRRMSADERRLSGWRVELVLPYRIDARTSGYKVVRSAITDEQGEYLMQGVPPREGYALRFFSPTGQQFAMPVDGEQGSAVSGGVPDKYRGILASLDVGPGVKFTEQSLPVMPTGVVYDSASREPVSGARVKVVTAPPGFSADYHLIGGTANQEQAVGAEGFYQVMLTPDAPPGVYTLGVTSPSGFRQGVSQALPAQTGALVPADGTQAVEAVQAQARAPRAAEDTTYYISFRLHSASAQVVNNHLPLDPADVSGLLLRKSANKTGAELGDFADYTLEIRNGTGRRLNGVAVLDRLPAGFSYVKGSARLNGASMADPEGSDTARIVFRDAALGLDPDSVHRITYRLKLGIGAQMSDGVNRAQATSGVAQSNEAVARVRVASGVFGDRGFIAGRVFQDCNRNGVQDGAEDLGIAGATVLMEDGTSVVTDRDGSYSFYGVKPGLHVLKVDPQSLPPGVRVEGLGRRGESETLFADVSRGELFRADFADTQCKSPEEIRARRDGRGASRELIQAVRQNFSAQPVAPAGDARARPAQGVAGGGAPLEKVQEDFIPDVRVHPEPDGNKIGEISLEQHLARGDSLQILNLYGNQVLPVAQSAVQVRGRSGVRLRLVVNGGVVPESRIGKRLNDTARGVQAMEYVGLPFKAGTNSVVLEEVDAGGNVRNIHEIKVVAPGVLARVQMDAPAVLFAGSAPVPVRLTLTDERGVKVTSRTHVTLKAGAGAWNVPDINPAEDGVQIVIEGGAATVLLLPPQHPTDATISVEAGSVRHEQVVPVRPANRPLVAVGLVEGALNLRSLDMRDVQPTRDRDSFDQMLEAHSVAREDGKTRLGGRTAFYLKGVIKGDALLTAAYDSEKASGDRLFRDIQPDEYYPVYGDGSERRFDAQSSGRLYIKVEKERNWILWGDFLTASVDEARQLTQVSRALNGAKARFEGDRIKATAYASRTSQRQVIEEMAANGTSGPFPLRASDLVAGSERVEVWVRDRNATGMVLSRRSLVRFVDYEIDAFAGRLTLKAPLPSFDEGLNPQVLHVVYESASGGSAFTVAGLDASVQVTDTLNMGAMIATERDPLRPFAMAGINATWRPAPGVSVIAEAGRVHLDRDMMRPDVTDGQTGTARRVEVKKEGDGVSARVYYASTGVGYANTGSMMSAGREEAGAKVTARIDDTNSFRLDALRSKDMASGAGRDGVAASVVHAFGNGIKGELGVRHAKDASTARFEQTVAAYGRTMPGRMTTLRGRLEGGIPGVNASVYGEYEQDTLDAGRRMLAAGGDYRINGARLYGRHEFISSLGSLYGLSNEQQRNVSMLGLEVPVTATMQSYNEYRVRDQLAGRETQLATGLRNTWKVSESWRLGSTFENVLPIDRAPGATTGGRSTAATLSSEFSDRDNLRVAARIEGRRTEQTQGVFLTAAAAQRLNAQWTALARTSIQVERGRVAGAQDVERSRTQVGAAYRPTDRNDWMALMKYEHRTERVTGAITALMAGVRTTSDVIAANVNYQPMRGTIVSGRLATKWVRDGSNDMSSSSRTHLVGGRLIQDLPGNLDFGVQSYVLWGDGRARQYGAGMELGYKLSRDLWMSAGYNLFGFRDEDLTRGEYMDKGPFVRLRFKFDEKRLEGLMANMQ